MNPISKKRLYVFFVAATILLGLVSMIGSLGGTLIVYLLMATSGITSLLLASSKKERIVTIILIAIALTFAVTDHRFDMQMRVRDRTLKEKYPDQ